MWLSKQVSGRHPDAAVRTGSITISQEGFLCVSDGEEIRNLPLFGPPGYRAVPPEGAEAFLVSTAQGYLCAGTLSLQNTFPEEIVIANQSGARLRLCENGDIELNGVRITREGVLLPQEKGGEDAGHTD